MDKLQNIQSIKFIDDQMILEIDDHRYMIDLNQVSNRLLNATEVQRNNYEISPANYGIHWPLIDEDLAIHNLIKSSSELTA